LSRRELEIARLVAEGLTNREIAKRLFLSERTVDGHLEHVREKLGVNTRAQIATWVVRNGDATPIAAEPAQPAQTAARPALRWRALPRRWLWVAAAALVVAEVAIVLPGVEPQGPKIFTVAGTSPLKPGVGEIGGYSGDGLRATDAMMSLPSDIAVSPDGTFYIADYRNKRIRQVEDGRIKLVAGGGKQDPVNGRVSTSTDIGSASNVAVDATGRPYMLTIVGGGLQVWTIERNLTMTLVVHVSNSKTQRGQYWPPPVGGLAVDARGRMYISDRVANRVYSYAPGDGQPRLFAGNGHEGSGGDHAAATGAELYRPTGLAIDRQGNVYIADTGNNRIRKVDTSGVITTVAGSGKYYGDDGDGGPATQAHLSFPFGVAVAGDGTIYIADTGNNRLRQVTPAGVILALAGTGTAGSSGDGGQASKATLAAPEGIALDGKGNLFVADTLSLRVREISGVHP
jgi:DNA-binding CsgD family transcriptional regulator/sugar lactone lactonase YvrE